MDEVLNTSSRLYLVFKNFEGKYDGKKKEMIEIK